MKANINVKKIIRFLDNDIQNIYGDPENKTVSYLRNPQNVDADTLDWISPARNDKQQITENSRAKTIITSAGIVYSDVLRKQGKVIIEVVNPKLAIAKIGNQFFIQHPKPEIHPTAIIHLEATIGKDVYIGPYTIIGKCEVGDNVIIHNHVTLYDNTVLKNNVLIHAGSIIGTDGLGCEREADGTLVKFPHFGGVIIEDNVEIGANCKIAKGALSNTQIGKGTKINVGCFIAHNVIIGNNVWISPKVNIAGTVKVERNTTIFSGVIIREQRVIGSNVVIGMGAVVTKNIPMGETWVGNPARKIG